LPPLQNGNETIDLQLKMLADRLLKLHGKRRGVIAITIMVGQVAGIVFYAGQFENQISAVIIPESLIPMAIPTTSVLKLESSDK
jgi:hypothetical protein